LDCCGECLCRREFHVFRDARCADIKRAAKDAREPEYVIYLIGKIAPASCHHCRAGRFCRIGQNFRIRICHCKNNCALCHGFYHLRCERVFDGNTNEHIGVVYCIRECALFFVTVGKGGDFFFCIIQILAPFKNNSFTIAHDDVFSTDAVAHQKFGNCHTRRAGAIHDRAHILKFFPHHLERVDYAGRYHHGRSVLVIVHDGYAEILQTRLNRKTFGCFDVFKIDSAEHGCNQAYGRDNFGWVF